MTAGAKVARRRQDALGSAARQVLRDAAHDMMREGGVNRLNMRALAARVGTSAMAAYRHYPCKDALVEAVRVDVRRQFGRCLERAAAREAEPSQRLVAMGTAYVRFAVENEQDYRLMFGQVSSPPTLDDVADGDGALAWHVLLDTLGSLPGREAAVEVLDQAHLVWATLHGLCMLHLSGRLLLGRSIGQLEEPLAAHLLSLCGLGSAARTLDR